MPGRFLPDILASLHISKYNKVRKDGLTMKFILKILLAPLMLVLWIIECVCKLVLKLSSIVFVLISILFVIAGIYHFVNGSR